MKITRWTVKHPWLTLVILLVATVFMVVQMKNLNIETDISAALPKNLPVKRLYDLVGEIFPSKSVVFVAIETDSSVYSPNFVKFTQDFTNRLSRIHGVYDVISPTNVDVIEGTPEGISVIPALSGDPEDGGTLLRMKERLKNSDFLGNLVSVDEHAFGILVLLKKKVRERDVAESILSTIDSLRTQKKYKIYASGRPVLEALLAEGLGRDVHVFFSLVLVIVIALLAISFRSVRGVLLPLTVVIASVLWTFGFMALVKIPFSHSTEFLPVLLISIGVADGIHILHMFYRLRNEYNEKKPLVLETMRLLNLPVIMTSLTTAVAFLSLGFAGFTSLKQLGISIAFGVLVAMTFSLYFIPATLVLLPLPSRSIKDTQLRWLHSILMFYGEKVVRHRYLTQILVGLFCILMVFGITRIKVENFTIENFPKGHEAREAYQLISKHFSGPEVVTAVIRGEGKGSIRDPLLLQEMDKFKKYLLKEPSVGNVTGIQDLIKRLNMVINGGKRSKYKIPDTLTTIDGEKISGREIISQYLALYELSSKPGELQRMVTPDFDVARMDIFLKSGSRTVLKEFDTYARKFIKSDFAHAKEVDLTGSPEILLTVNDLVVSGQFKSTLLSVFLVFLLVVIAFKSLTAGLYGIVPLAFALLVNFGLMGFTGMYANIENMVTSNIAIGVGVDYMIHFIHRYREYYRKTNGNIMVTTRETMDSSGVAILLNALTVALGFSTIMASMFKAVSQMGFLISLAMISTCFAALTILPTLLATFRPKFLEK